MYSISLNDKLLLVKFIADFDFSIIQAAILHETMMREYADTNDIWMFGDNHADICLGEIDLMVHEFQCRCSRDAKRTKTAVVVAEGLTGAKIELWVRALQRRVTFKIEIFRTFTEAKRWVEESEARVA